MGGKATESSTGAGTGRKVGRPPNSGANSTQIVALADTEARSYAEVKDLISFLPEDIRKGYLSTPITRKALNRIRNSIRNIKSGLWAVAPMVCAGDRCPYAGRCPLHREGLAPVTMDCPVEKDILATRIGSYMDALDIDSDDIIEMDQVGQIAMCDLMIMRVRNWMSHRPDGHITINATGVDSRGNVLLSRDIAHEIIIEEKYNKIKEKKLESLLATREAKAKYDVVDEKDPGVRAAMLRERAQDIKEKKAAEGDVIAQRLIDKAEVDELRAKFVKEATQSLLGGE